MDPNRFVERMLNHMQTATIAAQYKDRDKALAEWQEVFDNLTDLRNEWLSRGGFAPTLNFNFEILD